MAGQFEEGETDEILIVIPKEYPIILLACVLLCVMTFFTPFFTVARVRIKYFNKEFMEKFKNEHVEAFGSDK